MVYLSSIKIEMNKSSREPQPLVSICMPAYNVENTLGVALNSVPAQSYQNTEVILVDDGSTDGTSEVVRSFTDERIHYIRNKMNLGGYQTMNKAVGLAKGDFVAIYHSDDVYESTIIEKEIAYFQSYPQIGAVFCLAHFMDSKGNIFGGYTLPKEYLGREFLTYEDIFPFILRNKNILLCCPTFMVRHEVLNAIGSFDAEKYDIAADLDMWIRIVRRFPIGILNERLMKYRVGKSQWTKRYNYLRINQELYFEIMDHYIMEDGWLQKLSDDDLVEYDFHRCDDDTFRAANLMIRDGDVTKALELLQRPFPWRTLFIRIRRRKFRVLILRTLMICGLALGFVRLLARFLRRTEYGRSL